MTKTPHFFKAKSRIGLTSVPHRMKELNIGVENSPDAILTPQFLANFPGTKVDTFEFSKPEDIDSKNY